MTLAELKRQREAVIRVVTQHGGYPEVLVFGSTVRGDARADSDIDLVVELESGRSLLDRVRMAMDLEALLGHPVETVSRAAIHPLMRERVLQEARPL
jgi:hypothetical protein